MSHLSIRNPPGAANPVAVREDSWWWLAVKWTILAAVVIFFFFYFVGGYIHARRRMRRKQPLLGYHSWLISRGERARYEASLPQSTEHQNPNDYGSAYPLPAYAPPPPRYNADVDYLPVYTPPSKLKEVEHPAEQDSGRNAAPTPASLQSSRDQANSMTAAELQNAGPSQPPKALGSSRRL